MRPDTELAGLLGLDRRGHGPVGRATSQIDTGAGKPGAGLVEPDDPVPRHRRPVHAGRRRPRPLATLYSNASTATTNPAVTLRSVGSNGGQAAAFTYDLARSVVYTRQGNPAWAGQERDGAAAVRSTTVLGRPASTRTGSTSTRSQIPQADEQQRLLANLIEHDEPRPEAAAAVLVLPARREGRRRDDRRRPRATAARAGRFDWASSRQPGRLQRRRLGVRPRDVVHLPEHAASPTRRPRPTRRRASRSRSTSTPNCADWTPTLARRASTATSSPTSRRPSRASPAPTTQPHPLHRLERLGDAAEGRARPRHPARHELLLLAGRVGPGPARATSPARACRCASPTSTAR